MSESLDKIAIKNSHQGEDILSWWSKNGNDKKIITITCDYSKMLWSQKPRILALAVAKLTLDPPLLNLRKGLCLNPSFILLSYMSLKHFSFGRASVVLVHAIIILKVAHLHMIIWYISWPF